MQTKAFITNIRTQIASGETKQALEQLQDFLQHSPKLNEALLQAARLSDIAQQIRLGTVSFEDATITKNRINKGVLELLDEIEVQGTTPVLQSEMHAAVLKIENSKNVIANSTIKGNVTIGDTTTTTINTESTTSKNLRLFLFLLVPLLAIAGAYFWYQNEVAKQPLSLKVLLENTTPNAELPEPNGTLTLTYGGKADSKNNIQSEAIFEPIPSNFRGEQFRLQYVAEGFVPIDTSFIYRSAVQLQVRRNDDLAVLQGYIYEENSEAREGIAGVQVSIACCAAETDASGKFSLVIPFEQQRRKQRLKYAKVGYEERNLTEPVNGELIETYLTKK